MFNKIIMSERSGNIKVKHHGLTALISKVDSEYTKSISKLGKFFPPNTSLYLKNYLKNTLCLGTHYNRSFQVQLTTYIAATAIAETTGIAD